MDGALRQLHEDNQSNTALVEQVAANAAMMSERVREMQALVRQFHAGARRLPDRATSRCRAHLSAA